MAIAVFAVLFIGPEVFGQEASYNFEKGQLLSYSLNLETRISDPQGREDSVRVASTHEIAFYVLDKNPSGECLVAAVSKLQSVSADAAEKGKRSGLLDAVREWIASLKPTDSAAFVWDRWGNIRSGRMLWPDVTCYLAAKILEGLSLKKIDSQEIGAGLKIDPIFRGTVRRDERDFLGYSFDSDTVHLLVLIDPHSFLPYSLEARYGYATIHRLFVQRLSLTLSRLPSPPSLSALGPDKPLALAVLQAARLSPYPVLSREFLEKALNDSDPDLRLSASACLASKGTPDGLNLDGLLDREKNLRVRFNLAKAKSRFLSDTSALATILKSSLLELKERAENLLLRDAHTPPSDDAIRRLLETPVSALPSLPERDPA
ncbi:MAG: hypothetical protein MUP19_12105 [Candidatus Aminicenantes bacterium]|nr:hypothetical protein [Candidatus Aminicenantes bacterium]